jgi:gamma-glutamyltranspeptidase
MTAGGFLLNNQLTDFSFEPAVGGKPAATRVEPGKRPRSSMAPTIVYDPAGRVSLVVGSPGGSSIINYVAKAILATIDWKLDPQAAVALPNFGSRNGPVELEQTPVAALAERLARSADAGPAAHQRRGRDPARARNVGGAPTRDARDGTRRTTAVPGSLHATARLARRPCPFIIAVRAA